jgi:hypothetical protein
VPLQVLQFRDGSTVEVDAPIGASKAELVDLANRQERVRRAREAAEESRLSLVEGRRGSFSRGLDIGTDLVAQATGSSLEGIGSLLGLEGLEEYGAEVALENEADIQRKSRFQTRFDDIEGIGDFGSYLAGIAGESLPAMAAGIAGGIGAAAAAPAVGLGALGAGVAGVAGATTANVPFFYGMNRERQKDAIEAGLRTEVDEGAAFFTALPQALLDGIADRLLVGGLRITDEAIRAGGLFTRASKGATAGTIVEAPTEMGQQLLERAQAGLPLDNEEALAEYREAGIAGGLLGGSIRGTAAAIGGDSVRQAEARERARLAEIPRLPEDAPSGRQGELFEVDEDAQIEADIDRAETAEIEAMIAEDEAAETAAEIKRETTQRDMFDELETAEIEAEIDAEETAQIEQEIAAEEETARIEEQKEERKRVASEQETLTGELDTIQAKESEERRREILLDVVENQPTRQYNTLQKRFSRALEAAGIANTQPTETETATMQRVIDVARAEPVPAEPVPADSDVSAIEAQIPERRTAPEISDTTELRQTSLEGLGRRGQRTEAEPASEPRPVTEEDLTTAGFKKNAAIRQRVTGKDLNDPGVQADLTETANQFKEPKVKEGVTRLLEGVPSEQRGLFDPAERPAETKADRVSVQGDTPSDADAQRAVDPTVTQPSDGLPVDTAGRGAVGTAGGARRKRRTLVQRTRDKIKMKTAGAPTLSQPDAETGEITVTFNDGETRTMKKEDGLFVATDRPDPEGRILGSTPKQATAALEKQRKGPELQREASKRIGVTKTKRKAPARPKLKVAEGPTEEEARVTRNRRKKAQTARFKELKKSGVETAEAQRIAKEEFPDLGQTSFSKAKDDDYATSEQLAEGRTEKEIIEESNRLLKETKGGSLVDALKNIQRNANSPFEALVAGKVAKLIKRMESLGITFSYEIAELDFNVVAGGTRGIMNPARYESDGVIEVVVARTKDPLALNNGLTNRTVLHEAIHAVTFLTIRAGNRLPTGTKIRKDYDDIRELFNKVIRYGNEQIAKAKKDNNLESLHPALLAYYQRTNNSLQNPDELVTWALTDKTMQDYLDSVPYDMSTKTIGKGDSTLWEAVVNATRKLLGLPPKDNTALNELLRIQDTLLSPPTTELTELLKNTTYKTIDGKSFEILKSQIADPALTPNNEADARNLLDRGIKSVPILNSDGAKRIADTVSDVSLPQAAKDFVLGILSLNGLEMVAKKYVPKITELRKLVLEEGGRLLELKRPIDTAVSKISKFAKTNKEKVIILNRLMPYSSLIGVDPSKPEETYSDDAEKLKEWKAMTGKGGDYERLGKEGQAVYKQIRNIYASLFNEVGRAVQARLDATDLDPNAKRNVYDELMNKLYKKATIDPFFPLLREGEYRLEYTATDPETGQLEYYTENFETDSARTAAMKQLTAMSDAINLTDMNPFENVDKANYRDAPAGSFVNNVLGVLGKNGVDSTVQDEIIKLFLDTLPERSFAQSFRRREGYRGFIGDPRLLREETYPNHDMVRALRTRSASIARQIVRLEYGSKFQKLQEEIEADLTALQKDNKADKKTKRAAKQFVREVQKRVSFAKNPDVEDWAKNLTTFGFTMTLGLNVSSMLVNFSQLPMVIAPHLAGTLGADGKMFGFKETTKAIGEAVRLFRNAGLTDERYKYVPFVKKRQAIMDMIGEDGVEKTAVGSAPSLDNYDFDSKDMPPEIKEFKVLVEVATEHGQLNRSIVYDMLDLDEIDSVRGKIGAVSGFLFHHGERMTRQVALAASYRLMLDSMKRAGRKIDNAAMREAAEFAIYEVELTNGGTAAASAPRLAQAGIGKVAFLYKRYGVQMTELLGSLINNSVRGTKAEKQAARYQFAGVLGGSAVVAGAQGLPFFGAVALVYNTFKGDEDEELDTVVRKAIGEGFYGGIGNYLLGVDVASRMGLSDLIFRDRLIEKDQSLFFDMIEVLGGPVVGVGMQMERGFEKMFQQGEFARGIEAMSPAAIRNAIKSYRFYNEGALTQRGDAIVKDLPAPLLVGQFLGFAPSEYTRQLAVNAQLKKLSRAGNSQRTNLLRKYYVANRSGNFSEAREVRRKINEFNRKFPSLRITPDTIKRSMAQHMRTTKKMYSGVTLDPRMFNDLKQSAAEYDDTLTIWEDLGL